MLWRVLLELVLLLVLLFAGSSFWSCFKAPKHLLTMLGDSADLRRVIARSGYEKLVEDAQQVKAPPFGTFGDTISIWDNAHHKSLSSTRNAFLAVVLGILAASWWLGIWYFAAGLFVFLVLGFAEIPVSAKNNNANHLPSVILNLIRWCQEDEFACQDFCYRQYPHYHKLYDLLRSPEAVAPNAPEQE
jgi:hypothetical protein